MSKGTLAADPMFHDERFKRFRVKGSRRDSSPQLRDLRLVRPEAHGMTVVKSLLLGAQQFGAAATTVTILYKDWKFVRLLERKKFGEQDSCRGGWYHIGRCRDNQLPSPWWEGRARKQAFYMESPVRAAMCKT